MPEPELNWKGPGVNGTSPESDWRLPGEASLPIFEGVTGDLEKISELPRLDQLLKQTAQNPDQARWETEILLGEAKLEFEKSKRIPNVTVSAGLQRFEQTNDNALVVGLSIPIPIFDRNQGGIEEARHNLRKVKEEKKVADVRIKTELSGAYQILSASYLEAMTLKNDVLPAAQRVFDGLSEGYRQGKFRYLDVLDAQRTLFDAQAKYIEALANYHETSVEVERLIGQRVDEARVDKRRKGGKPVKKNRGKTIFISSFIVLLLLAGSGFLAIRAL